MTDTRVPYPSPEEAQLEYESRDAIADGLIDLLKPSVEEIDDKVRTVRYQKRVIEILKHRESQVELRHQIDNLADELRQISDCQANAIDLEPYVKKLNNSRRRVMLVNNILQNVQDRLNKLHNNVSKETAKRKSMLDPQGPRSK